MITPENIEALALPPNTRRQTLRAWAKQTYTELPIPLPEHILAVVQNPAKRKATEGKWNLIYCYDGEFPLELQDQGIETSVIGTIKSGRSLTIPAGGEETIEKIKEAAQGIFEVILLTDREPIRLQQPPWPVPQTEIREKPITINIRALAERAKARVLSQRPHWGRNRSWKGGKDPKGYIKIIHFNEEQFNSKSINIEKLPEVLQTRLETFVFIVSFGLNAAIIKVNPEKPTELSEPEILQGTEGRNLIAPAYHDTYCHAIRGIPVWEEAPKPMFQELDNEPNSFPIPSPKEFDPAALFGGEAHGNYTTVLVLAKKEGEKWELGFPQLTELAKQGNVFVTRRKAICLVMCQGRKKYTLLIKKRGKDPENTHYEVAENQEEVDSYYQKEILAAQELETLGGDDLKIGWEEPYPITDYNYVDDVQLEIIEDFVKGHEIYNLCAGNTHLAQLCLHLGATKVTTVDIGKRETLRYLYPSPPDPEGKIEEITHDLSTGLPAGHTPKRAIIASPPPNHVASKQPDWETILPSIPHILYIGANIKGKHPCGSPKFWAQLIPREITSVRVRSHGAVIEYGPNPREGNQVLREEGLGFIQPPTVENEQSNCLGEGQAKEILELLRRIQK